jgi:hypothetical protein
MTRQTFYCVIPVKEKTRDILQAIKGERGCTYDNLLEEMIAAQYGIPSTEGKYEEVRTPSWADK